jgi:hypothetical protein
MAGLSETEASGKFDSNSSLFKQRNDWLEAGIQSRSLLSRPLFETTIAALALDSHGQLASGEIRKPRIGENRATVGVNGERGKGGVSET